jgi:hypothetical protein
VLTKGEKADPVGSWRLLTTPNGSCWILTAPDGSWWILLDPDGSCWILTDPSNDHFLGPTRTHEDPRGPTRTHEDPRGPTRTHEDPRGPTRTHENPLGSTRIRFFPLAFDTEMNALFTFLKMKRAGLSLSCPLSHHYYEEGCQNCSKEIICSQDPRIFFNFWPNSKIINQTQTTQFDRAIHALFNYRKVKIVKYFT